MVIWALAKTNQNHRYLTNAKFSEKQKKKINAIATDAFSLDICVEPSYIQSLKKREIFLYFIFMNNKFLVFLNVNQLNKIMLTPGKINHLKIRKKKEESKEEKEKGKEEEEEKRKKRQENTPYLVLFKTESVF